MAKGAREARRRLAQLHRRPSQEATRTALRCFALVLCGHRLTCVLCPSALQLGLDRGPKDTRQAEDAEFGKKHLTKAQMAELNAGGKVDAYKKAWR